MHAYYGTNFNDIKLVVADHNVKITQGGRWATSDHAVLDQASTGHHDDRQSGNP